ncbi:hypothetical protein [Chamaesiphon polymorphus]|uniref:hypothetical protein n=1 Tax=Chamaesiphon polymorphus TaxID=2107691 RepID=UPI0015E69981|nr:hypothetical protein [Chamaesiphon polymorphus]
MSADASSETTVKYGDWGSDRSLPQPAIDVIIKVWALVPVFIISSTLLNRSQANDRI